MKNIQIVIGSSYGDEGKGRMVDYFSDEQTLVVRSNGGAQAGHTVCGDSMSHIFHHVGSGSLKGAKTYLSEKFIVNPMIFRKEIEGLSKRNVFPVVYVNEKCLISTPFDMLLNQISETVLAGKRYGSCGLGIWETLQRSKFTAYHLSVKDFCEDDNGYKEEQLKRISRYYLPMRLHTLIKDKKVPEEYEKILNSNLIQPFIEDIKFFFNHVYVVSAREECHFLKKQSKIVFENAQGLRLDMEREKNGEKITPSNTGICNPISIIKRYNLDKEFEVNACYCTRWYVTRHGEGRLPYECDFKSLSAKITDNTNIPNRWQGTLRFANIDIGFLLMDVRSDISKCDIPFNVQLALNCVDQIDEEVVFYSHGTKIRSNQKAFINFLTSKFKAINKFNMLYIGTGENSKYTEEVIVSR